MKTRNQGQLVAGAILVLIGIGLLALQFVDGFGEAMLFFLIGGAFIAGYLYRRAFGLLIPGGILLGIGLGMVGEESLTSFGDFMPVGLGIGFLAIYVIALIYEGRSPWWPLIPAAVLIIVGLVEGNETLARLFSDGWPLILIFAGLLVLAGAFGLTGRAAGQDADKIKDDAP